MSMGGDPRTQTRTPHKNIFAETEFHSKKRRSARAGRAHGKDATPPHRIVLVSKEIRNGDVQETCRSQRGLWDVTGPREGHSVVRVDSPAVKRRAGLCAPPPPPAQTRVRAHRAPISGTTERCPHRIRPHIFRAVSLRAPLSGAPKRLPSAVGGSTVTTSCHVVRSLKDYRVPNLHLFRDLQSPRALIVSPHPPGVWLRLSSDSLCTKKLKFGMGMHINHADILLE
ncbi:hypothetical protein EVAR_92707_1 [Eumeta japonica]|uniref:Uncharacterized protein n=1 Tax=Eumeta variegata TaxID=151549 RepID=A0A4C1SX69_EUMVA|nr:hypothetical protein EVAR_92707_1 [Eumeta japonica]